MGPLDLLDDLLPSRGQHGALSWSPDRRDHEQLEVYAPVDGEMARVAVLMGPHRYTLLARLIVMEPDAES